MAVLKKNRPSRRHNSSSDDDNGASYEQNRSAQQQSTTTGDKSIQMDRILCRAHSLDSSNISDLSGSVGHPKNRQRVVTNRTRSASADDNILLSILNDCAALTGISEVIAEGHAALKGGTTTGENRSSRLSQPNVWGVSPWFDDDSVNAAAKPKMVNNSSGYVQHDNIELVLDETFGMPMDTEESAKVAKSTSKSKSQLIKKVSSVLRRPTAPVDDSNGVSTMNNEMKKDLGPSLLDELEDSDHDSTHVPSNQTNTVKSTSRSTARGTGSKTSGQKKSSSNFLRFQKKKKSTQSGTAAKSIRATRKQIEEAKKWKSTLDKTTGKTYYFNSETNETRWIKPVGYDEACQEVVLTEKKEGVDKFWKATVDASTGKTYYYNKKTKEVSWTIPKGYKGSVRAEKKDKWEGGYEKNEEKNAEVCDSAKDWKETVDATTGKTYYYNKKTKMVSWEKPAGVDATSPKISDENADTGSVPLNDNEEPPDAPFDEPDGVPYVPKKAHFDYNNEDTPTDDKSPEPLYGRTKSLKSIEFTKQRTYASAMTDTTRKAANTGKPTKDFTNTQINVIKDSPSAEGSHDSAPDASRKRGPKPKKDPPTPEGSKSQNVGKTPVVSPSTPKRRYRTKRAENLGSDDDSEFDDWIDDVSALSGIGHEEKKNSGVKDSRIKQQVDSRTVSNQSSQVYLNLLLDLVWERADLLTLFVVICRQESSSQRDTESLDNNSINRTDDPKNWSKEQLDSFIAKNDWGQVAKYIAESRKSKGLLPQTKVGALAKLQQDSASQVSPDEDSVWQSLDDVSNGNPVDRDASFDYDKVAALP